MTDEFEAARIRAEIEANMSGVRSRRGRPRHAPNSTTYGQKGGEGPTKGKRARRFAVTLPDGTVVKPYTFHEGPIVGYCYQDMGSGRWIYNSLNSPDAEHLKHLTKCNAEEVT